MFARGYPQRMLDLHRDNCPLVLYHHQIQKSPRTAFRRFIVRTNQLRKHIKCHFHSFPPHAQYVSSPLSRPLGLNQATTKRNPPQKIVPLVWFFVSIIRLVIVIFYLAFFCKWGRGNLFVYLRYTIYPSFGLCCFF